MLADDCHNVKLNRLERRWLLLSSQVRLHPEYLQALASIDDPQLVVLDVCREMPTNSSFRCVDSSDPYQYPQILQVGLNRPFWAKLVHLSIL